MISAHYKVMTGHGFGIRTICDKLSGIEKHMQRLTLCRTMSCAKLLGIPCAASSLTVRPLPVQERYIYGGESVMCRLVPCQPVCSRWHPRAPNPSFTIKRLYRSTNWQKGKEKKETGTDQSENIDDLKSLLQNKSLSFTAKFKVLFQQYGVVLVVVHCITAAFWFGLFYYAISRGFDIVPFLEKYGVFNFLEKIGLPASDKLKSPGASNALAAYLLYEVAKPIRYPVTIIGTIYAVRILRRLGRLKRPPATDTTVRELMHTQSKIVRHHMRRTATKYRDHYKMPRQSGKKKIHSSHRNGRKKG